MFPRLFISLRNNIKPQTWLKQGGYRSVNTAAENEVKKPVKKYWMSYGFDATNEKIDRFLMHATFFVVFTIGFVGGAVALKYTPDPFLHVWARREAFLQMRYREEHGLPYIDRELVDPKKLNLPSDKELGLTKIII